VVTEELRRTAGRWRTGDTSPLGTFAATGTVVPGVDDEIQQSLEIVERGGLAFAEFDPLEEYEELRSLLEHVELELALGEARQLGSRHGASAAARWQREIGATARLGATTASVLRFMEAVEERDPVFVDALPVPASDFTVGELARRSGWHEPDPIDAHAHDRWSAARDGIWDAYEVAFYEAIHESVARWRTTDLVDASPSLDQPITSSAEAEAPRPWRSLRVQIVDDDALRALSPEAIQLHLSRRGWQRAVSGGNQPEFWELRTPDSRYGILAPTWPDAPDYPKVVRQMLRTLSVVEDRSELDIFRDLDPSAYAERVGRGPGPGAVDAAATLRKLADARRDYVNPAVPAGDRTVILQEAAVMERVADVLSGRAHWDDLVAGYAPSWRWHEFGDHDPQLTLQRSTEAAGRTTETDPAVAVARSARQGPPQDPRVEPFVRPAREHGTGAPAEGLATPPGWITTSIGRRDGVESEVVYDPRRFDVDVLHSDGEPVLRVRDRVGAARAALDGLDRRLGSVEALGPADAVDQSVPGVEL
jgi:hypothetical protein